MWAISGFFFPYCRCMIASRTLLRRCTTLLTSNTSLSNTFTLHHHHHHQQPKLRRSLFTRQSPCFSPLLSSYSNCATSSLAAGALVATSVVFFATFSTSKPPLHCETITDMAPSIQTNGTSSGPKKHKVVSGKSRKRSFKR